MAIATVDHTEAQNGIRQRAAQAEPPTDRFVFWAVDWAFYEGLLALIGDRRIRVTYDRGKLEVMSPSYHHESAGRILGRFVETLAEELDLPIKAGKSTTFRRQGLARGLEPDECFYIANVAHILGHKEIDLAIDPPPDLAIEVDISRSSLDRMSIYAALGVPEVWRFDGETFEVFVRQADATYRATEQSPSFPTLDLVAFRSFLSGCEDVDDTTLVRKFRRWVRASLPPPQAGDAPPPTVS